MSESRMDLTGQRVLVLEDETFLRKSLAAFLREGGAEVEGAATLSAGRRAMEGASFDFVLLDIHLPDGESLALLEDGTIPDSTAVVLMTARDGMDVVLRALRLGADDFLPKPFDPEALPLVFGRVARSRRMRRVGEHARSGFRAESEDLFFGKQLRHLRGQLEKILETDRRLGQRLPPVLLEGETGTGKSTLARWIHANGPRAGEPFVEVNCAALPESLAEAELFGHERGAFTDAREARMGLFEAGSGGTLFLDEISSLSLALQAKVLTAIEDQKIRRIGSSRLLAIDTRVIAASLDNLELRVGEGKFREDLLHRLNLLRIRIAPLRERRNDIGPLAVHLLGALRKRYRRPGATISEAGLRALESGDWPGNIRELRHEIERALIFEDGDSLGFAHRARSVAEAGAPLPELLNPAWSLPGEGFAMEKELEALTLRIIGEAMQSTGDNVSAAARLLGVPRDFVRYRLQAKAGSTRRESGNA